MGQAAKRTRENRTITVDFQDETTYFQLLGNGKAFVELVLAFILSLGFQLKHRATCDGGGCKPRHDLRYLSVHFSRPYRPVKGGGGETLRHPVTNCLLVACLLMPTFCPFCSSFLPLWGEREMVRFATRRTADDDPPSRL
jgi:hypothetical protein